MTGLPFDPQAVRALAAILAETGLSEIEVEGKDGRIRVVRGGTAAAPVAAGAVVHAMPSLPTPVAEVDDALHPGAVLSPIVGVVYLAAEPGAAPYVTVGQTVAVGQTVLLIEAMKTFNQIRATKAGIVTRILVSTSEPVEFGQPLLIVE